MDSDNFFDFYNFLLLNMFESKEVLLTQDIITEISGGIKTKDILFKHLI